MQKATTGEKIFHVFNAVFMIFMVVITIYPLWYVVVASFSSNADVMKAGGVMFTIKNFTLAAYRQVVKFKAVWTGYGNTLFIVILGTTLNIVLTAIGGYFLSRKNVILQKYIAVAIVITMYFSGGMIPTYLIVKNLGLYGNRLALILPTAISTYNMIIMRSAFAAVPISIEEAAKIDGAHHTTILFKIMLPLVKPTLAVLILYYGVGHWNSWFNAMIYLRDSSKFPLQLILREIILNNSENDAMGMDGEQIGQTLQYATIVIATFPILCIYPFMQKYFEKGVMIGSVKG